MSHLLPTEIEYLVGENVEVVFEPVLFTNLTVKDIGKAKLRDILPLVDYVRADMQHRQYVSKGINKKIYHSQVEKEIKKLVQCN